MLDFSLGHRQPSSYPLRIQSPLHRMTTNTESWCEVETVRLILHTIYKCNQIRKISAF